MTLSAGRGAGPLSSVPSSCRRSSRSQRGEAKQLVKGGDWLGREELTGFAMNELQLVGFWGSVEGHRGQSRVSAHSPVPVDLPPSSNT